MRNHKKILVFISIAILLSGCNTVRKGFTPDKRSGEEFLVEKKSPLVMPPDFNELPIPNQEKIEKENRKLGVKSLVLSSNDQETKVESTSPIEKLILEKINEN